MPSTFDVILRLMLDEKSRAALNAGIMSSEQALDGLQKKADATQQGFGPGFSQPLVPGGLDNTTALQSMDEQIARTRLIEEANARVATGIRGWGHDLRDVTRDFRGVFVAATKFQDLARTFLLAGTFITGGIALLVSNYIKNATEATAVTKAWASAQKELTSATSRIGAAFAPEALTLLQKAADLTDRIASFLESHPGSAALALKAGEVILGLGIISNALAKGFKLTVDVVYLAAVLEQALAAKLMKEAADEQLAAATIQASGGATRIYFEAFRATMLTIAVALKDAIVGFFSTTFGAILSGVLVGAGAYEVIAKKTDRPQIGEIFKESRFLAFKSLEDFFVKIGDETSAEETQHLKEYGVALDLLNKSILHKPEDIPSGNIADLTEEDQNKVVDIFTKFRETEVAEEKKTATARLKIIEDANKALEAAELTHA